MSSDLREFIAKETLFSSEAAEYLSISPQRLNQLVHSGKLKPVKQTSAGMLFLKSDLDKRKKEAKNIGSELTSLEEVNRMDLNSVSMIEAINYYTIQYLSGFSDKKAEPLFNRVAEKINVNLPFRIDFPKLSRLLQIDIATIEKAYNEVLSGFKKLQETDYVVKRGEEPYPKLLAKTKESPPYLFMRGNVQLLKQRIVSVVGTRNPSEGGRQKAFLLSKLLGKYKIVVASGLANGIDTAAHRGAIENNQFTIAVIGTPLNKVYPSENAKLQQLISEKGLVVSQFSPSSPVQRWNFPMRNAVMSGISQATVVVEASETSGALKQADYALKQGRLVFIPQSALDNPNIKWPKIYINRPGAVSFNNIEDLMIKLENSKIIDKDSQQDLFSEEAGTPYVY